MAENRPGTGWPPLELALSEGDIQAAMAAVPGYLDVTPADFREIYHLAFRQAVERLSGSLRARDVRVSAAVTVRPHTPLAEVAALMARHRISGVPVVDDGDRVAGIVSEHDFVTHAREEGGHMVIEILPPGGEGGHAHVAGDIMTREVATLSEDTPLPEIAARFAELPVNRLPVTDDQGQLSGIVARWDLVQSILAAFANGPETP
jgi:CBS-domain-containing membrane protein